MKVIQLLLLLVAFSLSAFTSQANDNDNHEFIGTVQLSDKSVITYKISFQEHDDETITGTSITDYAGDHRTESRIRGRINRKKNLISFSEIENTYTKSDSEEQDFCYIHLYNAKIKLSKKKSIIQGHFYSRYTDGSLCIEGDVYLIGQQQFLKQIEKVEKTQNRAKLIVKDEKKLEQVKEGLNETKVAIQETILAEEDQMTLKTAGDNITIKVWDAEYIDGDMISIRNDEAFILRRYSIQKKPKELTVPMNKDSIRLTFIANNEGRRPPNSANVEIITSEGDVPLKLQLTKDKAAEVLIVRK